MVLVISNNILQILGLQPWISKGFLITWTFFPHRRSEQFWTQQFTIFWAFSTKDKTSFQLKVDICFVNTKRLLGVAKSLVFIKIKTLCNVSGRATYATAPLSIVKLYYSCLLSQFSLGSGIEEKPNLYGYTKLINLMFPQQIFKFAWSISTVWKMDISAIKMTEF